MDSQYSDIWQSFIETLPDDIQNEIQGKKLLGVINTVKKYDIEVPQELLDDFQVESQKAYDHQLIMDSMAVFVGKHLEDVPNAIIRK